MSHTVKANKEKIYLKFPLYLSYNQWIKYCDVYLNFRTGGVGIIGLISTRVKFYILRKKIYIYLSESSVAV